MEKKVFNRLINDISNKIDDYINLDIIGKKIILNYDESIVDLLVCLPFDDGFIERYGIDYIKDTPDEQGLFYDVYAERIKKVALVFPNGTTEYFSCHWKEEFEMNEMYTSVWSNPMITIEYNEVELEVSLIDLIEKEVNVYILEYE